MIDFHTHILPGIDDGSASPEESVQMLRALVQQGVDTVVATPHFSALKQTPVEFVEQRAQAYAAIPQEEGLPRILLGAEVAYFNSMSRCEALSLLQAGNSGLLLIEMPFGAWSDRMIDDICAIEMQLGLTPVLAHVERYARKDQFPRYQALLQDQVLIQCNAQFFLKGLEKRRALKMLASGQIQFLGSDCHNMTHRAPNIGDAVTQIRKKLGDAGVQYLSNTMQTYLFGEGA